MKKILVIALVLIASQAVAQDQYVELLRSDLRTQKVAIITQVMQFSEEEGNAFWPVYREYQAELSKIGDLQVALIKDYAEHWDNMTDQKSKDIVKQWFDIQERRLKLRKTYFAKFEKVLTATDAAKFLQVENQIGLLIDLQTAMEIPLIQKPMAKE